MTVSSDADLQLLGQLAAEVRRRHHAAAATGRAADKAITANSAAQRRVSEAVRAIRELLAAMTDGAGHSGPHDLDTARTAALAILDRPEPT